MFVNSRQFRSVWYPPPREFFQGARKADATARPTRFFPLQAPQWPTDVYHRRSTVVIKLSELFNGIFGGVAFSDERRALFGNSGNTVRQFFRAAGLLLTAGCQRVKLFVYIRDLGLEAFGVRFGGICPLLSSSRRCVSIAAALSRFSSVLSASESIISVPFTALQSCAATPAPGKAQTQQSAFHISPRQAHGQPPKALPRSLRRLLRAF